MRSPVTLQLKVSDPYEGRAAAPSSWSYRRAGGPRGVCWWCVGDWTDGAPHVVSLVAASAEVGQECRLGCEHYEEPSVKLAVIVSVAIAPERHRVEVGSRFNDFSEPSSLHSVHVTNWSDDVIVEDGNSIGVVGFLRLTQRPHARARQEVGDGERVRIVAKPGWMTASRNPVEDTAIAMPRNHSGGSCAIDHWVSPGSSDQRSPPAA
jgi:hypothetical protein